jgi:hypothetical protein
MKNLTKKGKQEEEVAEKVNTPELDEMEDMKKFIRKKQLENKILKKISDEIDILITAEINRSKSA